MRKIILTVIACMTLFVKSTLATEIIVASAAGGTYHKFSTILASELKKQGMEVEIKIAGNCILGKKMYADSDNAIMFVSEATNAVSECYIPINKENYFQNVFTAGWVIVSKDNTLGKKMGIVSYMKQVADGLPVTLVPYKNTREIKAAFLAGEIDSGLVVQAIANGLEANVLLDTRNEDKGNFAEWSRNDLTLNYVLITKGNVNPAVLEAINSMDVLKGIAEKKSMEPILLDSIANQVEYLETNLDKWR